MARARSLKPSFFTNEDLGECSPLARLLFAGLWCWACGREFMQSGHGRRRIICLSPKCVSKRRHFRGYGGTV